MSAFILPPKPGTCPVCATKHESHLPHNTQSLTYQYAFYGRFGRFPNWWDATVTVSKEMRQEWFSSLERQFPDIISQKDLQPAPGDWIIMASEIREWEKSIVPGKAIPAPHLEPTIVQIPDNDDSQVHDDGN